MWCSALRTKSKVTQESVWCIQLRTKAIYLVKWLWITRGVSHSTPITHFTVFGFLFYFIYLILGFLFYFIYLFLYFSFILFPFSLLGEAGKLHLFKRIV